MKTTLIILSIAGFALSTICFGQLPVHNDDDLLFYTAYYNQANNRMEHRVEQFLLRSTSGDQFDITSISRTYFVPTDFDMSIEAWMTLPFESSVYEEEVLLESWMISPFESNYYEADLIIEEWMCKPFESDEDLDEEIEVEAWMTTIWV